MSVIVPEANSQFPETISAPVIGDRFTYPATVLQALTDLAERTRWLWGNATGDYNGVEQDFLDVNTTIPGEPTVALPPASRVTNLNPLGTAAYSLLQHIRALRDRFTDSSSSNVYSISENNVAAILGANIPVIRPDKSPWLNSAITGMLSKIAQLSQNDSGFYDRIGALEVLTDALNTTLGNLPAKLWGTASSPMSMTVPLLPVCEQAGPNFASITVRYPDAAHPIGTLFQPIKGTDGVVYINQITPTVNFNSVIFPVPYILPGSKIKSVGFNVKGEAGHSALPSQMPTLVLNRQTYDATTMIANFSDTSTNVSTYQSMHGVASSELSEIVDTNSTYYIEFVGEGGVAAIGNLKLYRIYMTIVPK